VWYGFVAPAGTPASIVGTLSTMINAVMDTSETKTRLASLGARSITVSNEQFAADIKSEFETARALAKRLGTTN
jgi:tripartite-type tricarboxylate transporter receptor subunit TctC